MAYPSLTSPFLPPQADDEYPNAAELIQWADGLLLVYSITDRRSFNYIRRAKSDLQSDTPVQLCANKVDMVHLRQVSRDEGEILAKDFECKFSEVSAADHVDQVAEVFNELCKEVLACKRKSKQSLLERMLGSTRPYSRGKSDSNLPKDWNLIYILYIYLLFCLNKTFLMRKESVKSVVDSVLTSLI